MRFRQSLAAIFCFLAWTGLAAPRDALWEQVEEAVQKRRPRTAIERLERIYSQATEEGAHAEAVRALAQQLNQEAQIEGTRAEAKIEGLEEALKDAPAAQRPVLETILGHWYWQFFQQNRWRIMQRTQTAAPPGEDIRSWGLPRLFEEIAEHFEAALADKERLLEIPIEGYSSLLEMGDAPSSYRPTLYDFLAWEALKFYSSGEQAGAAPEDAFVLEASSPVFEPADVFLAWEIETPNSESPLVKGLKLYQDLLRTHRGDQQSGAFLDANLNRLQFGNNHARGAEKTQRYLQALERFAAATSEQQISARARFLWASALRGEDDLATAQKVAAAGMEAYPDSPGGRQCFNLNQQIQAPALTVQSERVWTAPWPKILVDYKNLTRVHFRIVSLEWNEPPAWEQHRSAEHLNQDELKSLLARQAVEQWSTDLPATPDFHQRRESVPVPEDLAPGLYALIASPEADFGKTDNVVNATAFWVSDLSILTHQNIDEKQGVGVVLHARSGVPIEGARVQGWVTRRGNQWEALPDRVTDSEGRFSAASVKGGQRRVFLATHQGSRLATTPVWQRQYGVGEGRVRERVVLFTDRAIYRPGQTIGYKGICLRIDQQDNDYSTPAKQSVEVTFRDSNGKEIATRKHATNDYGSFSGSFTAPRERVGGRMSLRCTDPRGGATFRVEEYKRPKFQVQLQAPQEAPRLGETIKLTGTAKSYTGAAIDGAFVRYRVTREVRFPPWIGWYHRMWPPSPQGNSQEIAHGQAKTARDGSFTIRFPARPDPAVAKDSEPIFRYKVLADVTDRAGETRTGQRSVSAGYTALAARLSAASWMVADEPFELTVTTQTLDREPQAASGRVEVYALQAPETVQRKQLGGARYGTPRMRGSNPREASPDLSDPNNWELGEVVAQSAFRSDAGGTSTVNFELPAGQYRAKLSAKDRFGKPVKAFQPLEVLDPAARTCSLKIPYLLRTPQQSIEPGETFRALWGTGYDSGQAHVEIRHRGKVLKHYWTEPGQTQTMITQEVTEELRGGFSLHVFMVRENRLYRSDMRVSVPWSNKELTVKWERFRSKLRPGQEETWSAVITGAKGEPAAAEFAAVLYDASLDSFAPHGWRGFENLFYRDHSYVRLTSQNSMQRLNRLQGGWKRKQKSVQFGYPRLPPEVIGRHIRAVHRRMLAAGAKGTVAFGGAGLSQQRASAAPAAEAADADAADASHAQPPPDVDLSQVSARKNLQETAFFYPQLRSEENGTVRMEFTMPEALTQWRFMGLAHDRDLRHGRLDATATSSKDLMVRPNPPRFIREGDELWFSVKVVNQSPTRQRGSLRLTFREARSNDPADQALGLEKSDKSFDIPAKESRSFSWRIAVPEGMDFLIYKAVASTGRLSDGEEDYLPVLPRKILVYEARQLHIRGGGTRRFTLDNLAQAGHSDTLRHESLTLQMVSNPSWYAVLALPYLMEQTNECSEQAFNRLYANALAQTIATSDPRIRRNVELWRGTETLDSPLEKNDELKSIMLQETPWMRQADTESEARKNIAVLFEENRLKREIAGALQKVKAAQYPDGGWPWFPRGPSNPFVTGYITCGFGRLRHLGVEGLDMTPAYAAVAYLDEQTAESYQAIVEKGNKTQNHLSPSLAFYLYTRSFFLDDVPIKAPHREAVDYFLNQAAKHWTSLESRQNQAHIALALQRFGRHPEVPKDIVISLRQRSKHSDEMGMHWAEPPMAWRWQCAPVETQAMMIEVFDEVARDPESVEACKVWLLKQKQTQHWRSTKASADAVYALLGRGINLLADTTLATLSVGQTTVKPENVEAGTGFYRKRIDGAEVSSAMAAVTVKKETPGIAWGGVYWQYFEDVGKISPHEGTPLEVQKNLYVKRDSKKGPVLHRLANQHLRVGDELVVRIELRSDRQMEYLHLKDGRGSGLEPVNVLSRYRFQDGLSYYESTKDTATHFYIERLPKGTYVFEYPLRVQHRGTYQSGIAHIESMYAPAFNSHSDSRLLTVEAAANDGE